MRVGCTIEQASTFSAFPEAQPTQLVAHAAKRAFRPFGMLRYAFLAREKGVSPASRQTWQMARQEWHALPPERKHAYEVRAECSGGRRTQGEAQR